MVTRPLVFALFLFASVLAAPGQRGGATSPELKAGTFETRRFRSPAVDREVSYGIYLPKSYGAEGNTRWYPLVIWLHGMFEDGNRFHTRGGTQALDQLLIDGKVPEMIFVSPDGGRSSFFANGKTSGKWEEMVVKDLFTHLTGQYRIAQDARYRSIMGVSMGGMAALKIGMRFPELFGSMAAHSAALFPPDPENLSDRFKRTYVTMGERLGLDGLFGAPIDKAIWHANNPLHLGATLDAQKLGKQSIYFDCGTADRYEFHEPNQELHSVLKGRGVPHEWRLLQDVGHSWGSGGEMEARLSVSLKFVGDCWSRAAKVESPGKKPEPGKVAGG